MARGSKPGERRGGRVKGQPNKKNAEKVAAIEASGLTPLDYMLTLLRDASNDPLTRFEAAKAAAPYVHPKLSSTELKGDEEKPVAVKFAWLPPQS